MERASLHQRLKSLLTKLSSWKEEQPDDVTSTVWNENRDLIYDGLTKKDTTCCTACQVMLRMTTYEAPWIRRASWDDIGIRTAVVNLLVPASCPQEVKSLFSVPWQKLAAGIIRNCASDEETAKKMARDDKTVKAIICSTNDVRASNERINSLEALANLARVEVNRDQLWADVEDPILRVARRPGKKAVREAAFDALWYFAIDVKGVCKDGGLARLRGLAKDETLLPFWEFCVRRCDKSDEGERDDEFHSFAQSTLSELSDVEITGERTKQERDDERRSAAIDLEVEIAGESSTSSAISTSSAPQMLLPPKRRKVQGARAPALMIGEPSTHNGAKDSMEPLGSAFMSTRWCLAGHIGAERAAAQAAEARVEGSQLPTRVAEAARLLAATGEPGPSAPPPSAPPPSAPAGSPFAAPTGSDDALEAAAMEVTAKKMAHDETAKELRKRSEARMQSIAAARRKVADSEAASQQAEAARQQAEAKAKADSQVLADLLADDCGVGELDARLKQLKTEKDIALAKMKAALSNPL